MPSLFSPLEQIGGIVASNRVLRQTGENETGESPTLVTNGLLSSTLDSDPRLEIDSTSPPAADSSTIEQSGSSTTSSPTTGVPDPDLDPIVTDLNCTPPAIDDFPRDLFTQAQRRQGYLAIHFLASVYIFYCLALVCDEYFVPCIECICEGTLFHTNTIFGHSTPLVYSKKSNCFTMTSTCKYNMFNSFNHELGIMQST